MTPCEVAGTVTVSMHKISAGDGYLYLVRQVAAGDATHRGRSTLADYYSVKGEAPGVWMGRGLAALSDPRGQNRPADSDLAKLWAIQAGSAVSEDHMKALFGEGLHPNASRLTEYLTRRGLSEKHAIAATKLGAKFTVYEPPPFVDALAQAYREHNVAAGRPPSQRLDPGEKAAIKTRVARAWFADEFGRPPADDRELSGLIARNNRPARTSVAAFDLTCSPVKSVSAAWALAPLKVAQAIEDCHQAAVADVLTFFEDSAALTRLGTNGVAQVDAEGLIATAWTHRDSRAGDPDLHTHLVISAKVATIDRHGIRRWRALDAQPLHRLMVAGSELYNTRLEAHIGARLGWVFAEREAPQRGKRPIREVVGVPTELLKMWSTRRAEIEARTAELAKQFQHDHGREPTALELVELSQQATLETREAKHEPRSVGEQRATWRTQAVELLGHRGLTRMLHDIDAARGTRAANLDRRWVADAAEAVRDVVATHRAQWSHHHVLAEAQRYIRTRGAAVHAPPDLAARIADAALAQPLSCRVARVDDDDLGEPAVLRRKDGTSIYRRHGTQQYTSTDIKAAEQRLIAAARTRGARRVAATDIEMAVQDSAARGKPLNAGQRALVEEMAAGGRKLALALAPAGSGKTTAMAALSQAWRSAGGNVLGLAPGAAAAIELGSDLAAPTDTVAKYVHTAAGGPGATPAWFRKINANTMVIIDEVGKAGTLELDAVIAHALARGACIRLVGDDCQLASISAGGVIRDIAHETGALTLTELVRFHSAAEAAATLAVRAGDTAGLGYYIDHHRVHVGSDDTAADMAYTGWRADRRSGRDSMLLAPTNATVDELNARARRDRLADAHSRRIGREVVLADGLSASAGDIIRTRDNDRSLTLGRGDYVRNGYRYTITVVRADGSVKATQLGTGKHITLPADYVAEHVTLGYAATIDLAQGLTAGFAAHIVGAASLTRQLLYVALTRGRAENHIYLSTSEQDPHKILSTKATHPETAVEVLTAVLARDGAQTSATTAERQAHDPFLRLGPAADMYDDALGALAEIALGAQAMADIDTGADTVYPALTDQPAWPALRTRLALIALRTESVAATIDQLAAAAASRELHTADDVAAVLHWRLEAADPQHPGPLQW
ncbi:MobF family relaxase, partial [Mycobacterium nebraskense]|uniref:MobF family relaxase n=1 Tax=Mycobacterium nebraskense TaxID=244292 RepID=UPI001FC9FD23